VCGISAGTAGAQGVGLHLHYMRSTEALKIYLFILLANDKSCIECLLTIVFTDLQCFLSSKILVYFRYSNCCVLLRNSLGKCIFPVGNPGHIQTNPPVGLEAMENKQCIAMAGKIGFECKRNLN
jgi:hypothetical protein